MNSAATSTATRPPQPRGLPLLRRPPTLLAAMPLHAPLPGARGLGQTRARPGMRPGQATLSWCSTAPAAPALLMMGPGARPRSLTRAAGADGPSGNNQEGGGSSSSSNNNDERRPPPAVSTRTATPAPADADASSSPSPSPQTILVFDAAVPSSGLAPAQVERLAAQLLPLLEAHRRKEDEDEHDQGSGQPPSRQKRRFLVAEGRPASSGGGDPSQSSPSSSPPLERALAQLASALGATLALSEPPDPRRAFELAAASDSTLAAAEAAVAAALAEGRRGAPAQAQGEEVKDDDEEDADDDFSRPSRASAPLAAATFPPSRRLDLPDLALRPRPPEAPGSQRRRHASWQRALELAYFLLQLSAAGIGFRLHRVGDGDSSDEDDDSDLDDDDIAALMADDSDDDDDEDDEDTSDDGSDEDGDGPSTGVERSSDASIRLGGPGIWEIFSGGDKSQRGGKDGEEADEAKDGDSDEDEDDGDGDESGGSRKRRRNGSSSNSSKSLDKARHTLSITFARPDALRGDLGRKLFGGRTRGTPTPAAASLDDDGDGGGGKGAAAAAAAASAEEEEEDDAAAADAEAAERARLYRIAEGFDTDEGDLPGEAATAQQQPKPPPAPPLPPALPAASALDAIAALEATTAGGGVDDDDDDDGPFEVVSVRPDSPAPAGKSSSSSNDSNDDDDEAAAAAKSDDNDDGNDEADEDDDEALTDEQMGAVAAEVLADAREGELRGARTLRLTGVGLGDMVLLASGLLAVSQGRDPTKSEMSMLGRLLSEASVVPDDEAAAAADGGAGAAADGAAAGEDGTGSNSLFLPSGDNAAMADGSGSLPSWIFGNAISVPGGGVLLPLRAPAALRLGPGTGRGLGRGRRVARGARRQALLGQDVPVRDDLSPLQRPASEGARGGRDRRARALAQARAAARRRREPPGWASVEGGAAAAAAAARRAAGPLMVFDAGDDDEEEEDEEAPPDSAAAAAAAAAGAYGSFEEEAEEAEEDEEDEDAADADADAPSPAAGPSVASLGGLAYAALARLRAEALVRRALELRDEHPDVEVVLLAPPTLAAAVRAALATAESAR